MEKWFGQKMIYHMRKMVSYPERSLCFRMRTPNYYIWLMLFYGLRNMDAEERRQEENLLGWNVGTKSYKWSSATINKEAVTNIYYSEKKKNIITGRLISKWRIQPSAGYVRRNNRWSRRDRKKEVLDEKHYGIQKTW